MPELSFDFTEQEFRDIALKGISDEMGDEILTDIDEAARMWVEENPSRRDNYGTESAPVIEVNELRPGDIVGAMVVASVTVDSEKVTFSLMDWEYTFTYPNGALISIGGMSKL